MTRRRYRIFAFAGLFLLITYFSAYLFTTEVFCGRLGGTHYRVRLFHSVWHKCIFSPILIVEERLRPLYPKFDGRIHGGVSDLVPDVDKYWLNAPSFSLNRNRGMEPSSNECINNLRMIDAAENQWMKELNKTTNDMPTWDDLRPYIPNWWPNSIPVCPNGGTYTLGHCGELPTCSFGGIPRHSIN